VIVLFSRRSVPMVCRYNPYWLLLVMLVLVMVVFPLFPSLMPIIIPSCVAPITVTLSIKTFFR